MRRVKGKIYLLQGGWGQGRHCTCDSRGKSNWKKQTVGPKPRGGSSGERRHRRAPNVMHQRTMGVREAQWRKRPD